MIGIASVDKNWKLSINGAYVYKLKGSLNVFRELTTNKVVVMDKGMLNLLPKKQALKNRINICYCEDKEFKKDGFLIVNSKDQLFELISFYGKDNVFLFGTNEFYNMILPYFSKIIALKFDGDIKTDGYFVNLDKDSSWKLVKTSDPFYEDGVMFYVCEYKNLNLQKYNYGYEKEEIIWFSI